MQAVDSDLCFSWTQIASSYGVSSRTSSNIDSEKGLLDGQTTVFTPISDNDLWEVCSKKR